MVICVGWGANLHMVQLIPLPLTVFCFSKIRIGVLPSWYWTTKVVPDKGPLNRYCCFVHCFWPTVLSVMPLVHCVSVCLSVIFCLSVCDVLYCGKTVRPSEKLSEGVNRKSGSKSWFFSVAAIFLLPVSALRPPRRRFCPYSPAIGTRWYKWTF